MSEQKPVVIFGTGDLARVLSQYMRNDGDDRQVAYCVNREYLSESEIDGFEVVPFDEVVDRFPPDRFEMIVAIGYSGMNGQRARVFEECRKKGYTLANFVGSRVLWSKPLTLGENCIVFDGAVVQPFVELGNNVVLWGQLHVGHHSTIEDHVFLAGATVAGRSRIGAYSFVGAGAVVTDNVKIGERNLIGAGVTVNHDTEAEQVFRLPRAKPSTAPSSRIWK